jgi:Flp pilus assembly pilin Flp
MTLEDYSRTRGASLPKSQLKTLVTAVDDSKAGQLPHPGLLDKPWSGKDNQAFRRGNQQFPPDAPIRRSVVMSSILARLWTSDDGQSIAEYAVIVAVIIVAVVGTIRLIGSNANAVFSQAASSIQ